MDIFKIEKTAKKVLEETGSHSPQIMFEQNGKTCCFVLMFGSDEEKVQAREKMRELINSIGIDSYFFVTEGWMKKVEKGNHTSPPWVRPQDSPDRTEGLIAIEFKKDMTHSMIINQFEKKDEKIAWGERTEDINSPYEGSGFSFWNFFVEEEGTQEVCDMQIQEASKKFISELSKKYAKKYAPLMKSAKTDDERMNIITDMTKEMKSDADKFGRDKND